MPRFSEAFALPHRQAALDFVDVDLNTDNPLYIDPYAIQIRHDEWSEQCGDCIRSFFSELLESLRSHNEGRSQHLLSHLREPNETFLGESLGRPRGRGVGEFKAAALAQAIRQSRALQTGILSDISDAELFIYGVGRDTISDLTTNIIRGPLAEYTLSQCELHGIETYSIASIGPCWNLSARDWESRYYQLPVYQGRPILLVPKFSVRLRLAIDSQEFYNFHMTEFLQGEYLRAGGALVTVFKNGNMKVHKKDVQEKHPFIKDDLAEFVRQHPEVLKAYKELKGAQGALDTEQLIVGFDEKAFAAALRTSLSKIPVGRDNANEYHSFTMGICTFLFYPHLITPIKEKEIHDGRKRIDIKYANASTTGFFHRIATSPQTRALSVMIECKNYSKDINNPELDQMSSRFGHQRGFFGIILCRRIDQRDQIVKRCKDTVNDSRGYVFVFDDSDLKMMLQMIEDNKRTEIDKFLNKKLDELIN